MKAVLLNAGRPAGCKPLTVSRDLSALRVANVPLGKLQAQRLVEAGFHIESTPEKGEPYLSQRGDSWVSSASLGRLVELGTPAVLVDGSGTMLAWVSFPEVAGEPVRVAAEGEDFLIRYPWDLLRLNEVLLGRMAQTEIQGSVSPAAYVEGHMRVGRGTRILPGVYVEGNVVIGENSKIGPNCYLRGCTSIGDHCHIGNAVEVKNSIIENGSSIGHLSYCGDSLVGENVNLGAGTITANLRHDGANHRSMVEGELIDTGRRKFGAVIGDGVHTGIHTSIYPGRKLWPGTSTRPGDIVRFDLLPT